MKKIEFFASLALGILLIGCKDDPSHQTPNQKVETTWYFPHFEKVDSLNPILKPSDSLNFLDPIMDVEVQWEERNVLNPTALVKDDKVYLLYRAQDKQGTSRIGLAISEDGLHFKKETRPIFFPDEDSLKSLEWNYKKQPGHKPVETQDASLFDGVEDPRIILGPDGNYFMTYTSYDGKTARLSIASSKDLINWEKHGLVIKDSKFKDRWSKAGAIVGERIAENVVAKKINGKYWMYFGDTSLFMASSDDLINWKPLINEESGELIEVLHPRPGYFDSRLVEPGPYGLYTDNGILLIYNSSNAANLNDGTLPKFTYSAGQALFDRDQPYKIIDRTTDFFITPDKEYEKVGEVNEVCFVEGLVYFRDKWFLYYGTADSKIAVAVYNGNLE